MIYVTKKLSFSAAHRLFNPELSDDQNRDIYDKCNNERGHGHNYTIEVTVCGLPNPNTGYVIDLKKLKYIIETNVIDLVDHKHLNFDVEFLSGIIPTVENIVVCFWNTLKDKFLNCKLYKIKLYETETSFVEYFGEPVDIKRFIDLSGK